MITVFGKYLRELRHMHTDLLKDMADKLNVSAAFLSAVESGKKSIPPTWPGMLQMSYQLSAEQRSQLNKAFDESQKNVTIDLSNQSGERRGVAVALARTFNDLSDEQLDLIKRTMFSVKKRGSDE